MSLFPSCIVEIFSTPGVTLWTKRAGARYIFIQGVGAGGGGQGGGCAVAAGTIVAAFGGQGGAYNEAGFSADIIGATENVTIGAGGIGSPAQTVGGTAPGSGFGLKGGATSFGVWFFVAPGDQATGFQTGAGFGQLQPNIAPPSSVVQGGNQGGIGGSAATQFTSSINGGAAGGNGGGITAGAGQNGNQGGAAASTQNPKASGRNGILTGGGGQSANTTPNGLPGTGSGVGSPYGAAGGGGGGGMQTPGLKAGDGGTGGNPGGGGGGGGGSIAAVSTGGVGGNGGNGVIIITTYF